MDIRMFQKAEQASRGNGGRGRGECYQLLLSVLITYLNTLSVICNLTLIFVKTESDQVPALSDKLFV
jgi:hypothetical protein